MKKIFWINTAVLITIVVLFSACKKSYITGGTPENVNMYKNTTTYDVLKSNPLYDTLVQLIDVAGIKDKINEQGTTFFAPSNFSVLLYLNYRTIYVQNYINQDSTFGLDSLKYYLANNLNGTRDSMLMYLIHTPLPFSALTNTGVFYPTELAGDTAIVSYEYIKNGGLGYNNIVSSQPQLVYFTQLWYHYDLSDANPAGQVPLNIGIHTLIKTSGIITQNGILNELDNSNPLFFYDTKQ
ncbi:MAG: hypothetical protein M3Z26_10065 [Bacteroidota bacterium]|nr:hypothetical protein [Bacteroidota bacterium]